MDNRTKAILLMMAFPPLLSELMSGWMPASAFFQPLTLLIEFLGYSLPVLIIREFAVRRKLGLAGIITLGMAYGIFNEGLGSKSILSNPHTVNPAFTDYGYILGINLPSAANIMVWHSLSSVLFPILLVHYLYPGVKKEPWLGRKTTIALAMPSAVFVTVFFFSPYPFAVSNPVIYFAILASSILGLALVAMFTPKSDGLKESRCSIKPLFLGMALLLAFGIGTTVIAGEKLSPILFFSYAAGVPLLFAFILRRKNWLTVPALVLFGLGFYIILGISGISDSTGKGFAEGVVTGIIFEAALIWTALRIQKRRE